MTELPRPVPKPTEILVKVRAIGVNRIDLAALANPQDQVIGMEWAGEVAEVGRDVSDLRVGDRVAGTGAAAYAEYVVTDFGRVVPLHDTTLEWSAAAALPLGLQTMHDALVTRGRLGEGHTVLMHGAASAMGIIGMQIAKVLGAGMVIGTSGNTERRGRLLHYGCDLAVDSTQPDWALQVMAATGGKGADIVIDNLSGPAFKQCMAAAALGARLVNVGRLAGAVAEFDFNLHALRRLEYIGVTFRTRTIEQVRALNAVMLHDLRPATLASRKPQLPVARTFSFDRAAEALEVLARSEHFGKLVLTL
jgi:NADPH2:quinone reductase